MKITIPISAGELVDKITILEIKSVKIKDKNKLAQGKFELNHILKKYNSLKISARTKKKLNILKNRLLKVNASLWNTEDAIRKLELSKDFGEDFISRARSVYITNDKRFKLKNEINMLLGSAVNEVKDYKKYK